MKAMLCLILDRSGSMQGKESDVIGGVNNFITEQQKLPDEAVLSMVRFDTEYEEFRPSMPLQDAKPITAADYQPRGSTALLDAVGRALGSLDGAWVTHQPERCIVVIVTDGEENSSKEFKREQIKDMIKTREASGLWSFVYLGADVNAFAEASAMGIASFNTAQYTNTAKGTRVAYGAMSASVGMMRSTGSLNAGLGGQIAEDDDPAARQSNVPPPTASWTPPQATKTWKPPQAA